MSLQVSVSCTATLRAHTRKRTSTFVQVRSTTQHQQLTVDKVMCASAVCPLLFLSFRPTASTTNLSECGMREQGRTSPEQ